MGIARAGSIPAPSTKSRYRITVITSDFQSEDLGSIPGTCSMKPTVVRIARIKGTLALIGSQPFNESLNAPRYSVQDPALCGHATGDGEQTISKSRRYGFIYGEVAQLAERYPCKVKDVGSNPIFSTIGPMV